MTNTTRWILATICCLLMGLTHYLDDAPDDIQAEQDISDDHAAALVAAKGGR